MGMSLEEGVKDGMALVTLVNDIKSALGTLPPKASRKLVDYAKAFKVPETSELYRLLDLIDTVEGDIQS